MTVVQYRGSTFIPLRHSGDQLDVERLGSVSEKHVRNGETGVGQATVWIDAGTVADGMPAFNVFGIQRAG